ncbi:MAG: pyruvate dehydrogenase (acetyl-transferring) E1 component subunit alpha, partial [Acidimicrobiia bacterium]|nr:pyruvate dehydrogenase (acetyl-transferring) E1 component subunit alpha [Acidimicrobiia bacterium]
MNSELLRVLDVDGTVVGEMPELSDKDLVDLYRLMLTSRTYDRKATGAQRQGRLGTYPMLEGQEAVQIGSAAAFEASDFIYPSYREHGVQLSRGMPLDVILRYWRGLPNTDWDVHRYRTMITTVPIASQLPQAVGHAYAAMIRGESIVTGTYLGDGATSETDFHAGMNFAGVLNTPTVFICSNNGYAISVPLSKQTAAETLADKAIGYGMPGVRVDGMDVLAMYQVTSDAVDRARRGEGPTFIEAVCYRYGAHATADDARLYRSSEEEEEWRRRDPIDRMRSFLLQRNLWDEESEAELLAEATREFDVAMDSIEAVAEPPRGAIVRHVYDRIPRLLVDQLHRHERLAGEQESPIEEADIWQPARDPEPSGPTERWTMAQAINAALREALEDHQDTVILGEDVGLSGGVFRITEGLQKDFGDQRVLDTPLNESGIVGTAAGMAINGARAIAEIQFDGFVYPAFDQIVSHLGRMRFRTQGNVTLPLVVRFPNGAGIGAHEHHCDSPEAYFMHAPGLVVIVPSTPTDAKGLLRAAIESPDPVIFLEPKVLYRAGREDVPTERFTIPIGKARTRRTGADLTLVTYGGMVPKSLKAAETVSTEGIDVEVIDLRTIFPWDTEAVLESVSKTGHLLVVQEPQGTAGVASEVAAYVAE